MSSQEYDPLLEEFSRLQQKYGRLQEKYDKLREGHDKLHEKYDKLHFANEQSNARESQSQSSIKKLATECRNAEACMSNLQNEVHNLSRQCSQAQRAHHEEQELAAKLHQQLLVFKKEASASARVANQLTDDEIRSKMDTIFYSIQDFVMRALRRGAFDPTKLHPNSKVWAADSSLDPERAFEVNASAMLVSLCCNVLVQMYDSSFYFGFSSQPTFVELRNVVQRVGTTQDRTALKEWLERTRKLLFQMDREALHQADKDLETSAIQLLAKDLGDCIAVDWNASEATLRKILGSAAELFRALHSSKATFDLETAPVRDGVDMAVFDMDKMTSVNSAEEEAALIGRPIEVSVFPGIFKYGDEHGQNAEQMTVVCKARVVPQQPRKTLKSKPQHGVLI
ncbi:hypothetical protein D0864_01495 [Hortaea werneckii]|uniref:Uncharacterized protein n=1 Tax=Hortaea werneckii TaxID=91943 RepID=A0A3M7H845_HORWE|nr:hypothetical protein D0864_01495 [Hortaea werneckii]